MTSFSSGPLRFCRQKHSSSLSKMCTYKQRLSIVLVSNNNMYIDIKPYFCFFIDRYWNIGSRVFSEKELPNPFTSFRSFPKRKQTWRFRFSGKWNLTKNDRKTNIFLNCYILLYPQTKVGDILDSGPSRRRRRRRNFLVDAITQKQINIFFSNLVHMLRVPKGRSLF